MLRKIAFCILIAFIAVYAQVALTESRAVPKLLNYQGYLTDTLGIPVDDSLDMTFSIYTYKYFGSVLWTEDTLDVVVERGIFHALLGSVNPIPDSVFTGGTSRWLQIDVDAQTLSPRTQITAMGYAYTAMHADTAAYAIAGPGVADDDWLRGGTNDTVLFTGSYLGIARGGADNQLYGSNVFTHTNLGVGCTTGVTHENMRFATICGGEANRADSNYSSVVGGRQNIAESQYSFVGGGRGNITSAQYAKVGGGEGNSALWKWSVVGGGYGNTADYPATFVGGGEANTADGQRAVVVGGRNNHAAGDYSAVGGGDADTATGSYSVIAGGRLNKTLASYATVAGGGYNRANSYAAVAGGYFNAADGGFSFVGGGWNNVANANYAVVSGGHDNTADSSYCTISGGHNNAASYYATTICGGENDSASAPYCGVFCGYSNLAGDSYSDTGAIVCGGYDNTATNRFAVVCGGRDNTADGQGATIGGGESNSVGASAFWSTIAGGYDNSITESRATIGGGEGNVASELWATVAGGHNNTASGRNAAVGGGVDNEARGWGSVIAGGYDNYANGDYSAIPGGNGDTITANGDYSMAFGNQVYVQYPYYVVFFDENNDGCLHINRDQKVLLTYTYPIHCGADNTNGYGAFLSSGGVWTDHAFIPGEGISENLEGGQLLDKIENMTVIQWTYRETGETHISPAADQFYQAFECGSGVEEEDGVHIASLDVAGVSLRAVQELNRIIETQQAQIEALEMRIEQLEGALD